MRARISTLAMAAVFGWSLPSAWADPSVSLTVKDAPVDQLLHEVAKWAGVDVVVAEAIDQRVSLHVEDQSPLTVLETITTLAGLTQRRSGGLVMVASPSYWSARDQAEPLAVVAYALNHRDVQEAKDWIEPHLTERGRVEMDAQANRLWVWDIERRHDVLGQRLATFDQPIPQVLIESRIVIAQRDFNRALGMAFGVERSHPSTAPDWLGRAVAELPLAAPNGQIQLALLNTAYRLDAELSAMEAQGQGRVISTPRVMVSNRSEAFIQQGVAVPFEAVQGGEGSNSGAVSVQFREAVLALKTTPLILPDGRIQLDLHITQDTVGQIFQTGRGGTVPSIDTRALGTRVWVNNEQTLVLGGIFQEQDAKLSSAIPGLSQLPGLGRLFQRRSVDDERRELLIFITPTVVE